MTRIISLNVPSMALPSLPACCTAVLAMGLLSKGMAGVLGQAVCATRTREAGRQSKWSCASWMLRSPEV